MKGSTAIVKILKIEGIPFVTGYPGGGPNSIVAQTINESRAHGLQTILARSERGCVNIVDARVITASEYDMKYPKPKIG